MFNLIITAIFFLTIYFACLILKKDKVKHDSILNQFKNRLTEAKETFTQLARQISQKEEKTHTILKLYEINRKLATLLDADELVKVFLQEAKRIRGIQQINFSNEPQATEGLASFHLENLKEASYLNVKCTDKDLLSQLPYLVSQLKLLINRAHIYEKLQKISITDSLTHIANRSYFMKRYEEEFSRSEKFGLPLSFLMIDIDHFKNYNDKYGHLVGDVILRELARGLRENIREIDFIGRFGGEEFSVFLPQTSKEQALQVAERLRETIADTEFSAYDEKVRLTVSIGIATFPQNSKDRDFLIEVADKTLYKAKQAGRNRVYAL
jgi:diguanylate cyclase (GGDEF)-like protein